MSPINVQPFLQDGVLYGFDDANGMLAIELPSGKRLWNSTGPVGGEEPKGSDTAFMVKNGDRFFFFAETGHLVIGKLSQKGYEEISLAESARSDERCLRPKGRLVRPAYADKKAFIRNGKEIICVDLAK